MLLSQLPSIPKMYYQNVIDSLTLELRNKFGKGNYIKLHNLAEFFKG